MKKTMKTKNIGLIFLLTLMLASPTIGTMAWTPPPTYPAPSDNELKQAVADYMVARHPELTGLLDYDIWDVELSDYINGTRFKLRASWVDEYATYELVWFGAVLWTRYSPRISVLEFYYRYEVDITVVAIGPGTTVDPPGIYRVDGGDYYYFTAEAAESEFPEEYNFRFVKWTIDNGVSVTTEYGETCSGYAYVDLVITAIFETRYMSYCNVIHEDGLSQGYMWRDDHVLLAIRLPKYTTSQVTVLIESDYGTYSRTFLTQARSLCIYFRPYWFIDDYIVTVIATNIVTQVTHSPSYQLAGLD